MSTVARSSHAQAKALAPPIKTRAARSGTANALARELSIVVTGVSRQRHRLQHALDVIHAGVGGQAAFQRAAFA